MLQTGNKPQGGYDPLKGIKNVAIYVRKSRLIAGTDEQETLDRHRKELIQFAESNDLKYILFEEVESGTSDDRKEFLRMLSLIENLAFDALLAVHVDRILRNELDKARLNKALLESDTLIIQTNPFEVINLSDDSDYEKLAFRAFFAEHEARQIKRRFKAGIIRSALQGKWVQDAPYGYKIGPDGYLEIIREEAEVLKEIAERYINREVPKAVAIDLNQRGVPAPKGNRWWDKVIRQMLANEVYVGTAIYGKARYPKKHLKIEKAPEEVIRVEEAHPAIFDKDTWAKIQDETARRRNSGRSVNGVHIFSGLLKCAVCGKPITMTHSKYFYPNGEPRIYVKRCTYTDAVGNRCPNKGTSMYMDVLNIAVYQHLHDYYGHLVTPLEDNSKAEEKLMNEKKRITAEITKLENAKLRILELYEYGDIDRRTFLTRTEERDLQLDELRSRLHSIEASFSRDTSIEEKKEALEQVLKIMLKDIESTDGTKTTREERKAVNTLLHKLLDKIVLIRLGDEVNAELFFR